MNPGRFFVEVLESHKFRRSDRNVKSERMFPSLLFYVR